MNVLWRNKTATWLWIIVVSMLSPSWISQDFFVTTRLHHQVQFLNPHAEVTTETKKGFWLDSVQVVHTSLTGLIQTRLVDQCNASEQTCFNHTAKYPPHLQRCTLWPSAGLLQREAMVKTHSCRYVWCVLWNIGPLGQLTLWRRSYVVMLFCLLIDSSTIYPKEFQGAEHNMGR